MRISKGLRKGAFALCALLAGGVNAGSILYYDVMPTLNLGDLDPGAST